MDIKCDENWDNDEEFNSDHLTSPDLTNHMVIRLSPNQKTYFAKKEKKIIHFKAGWNDNLSTVHCCLQKIIS